MYIFLDDLPIQTGVCLNNGRQKKERKKEKKKGQKQGSLPMHYPVIRIFEITEKHDCCSRGVNVSMIPFHSRFPCPSPCLCESKLSESIAVVIGMEEMASVRRNVRGLNSQEAAIFIRRLDCLNVEKSAKNFQRI